MLNRFECLQTGSLSRNRKFENPCLPFSGISAGAALFGIFLLSLFYFLVQRRRRAAISKSKGLPTPPSSKGSKDIAPSLSSFSKSIPSYPYTKSDIEKGSTFFGVQVFNYMELESATNNFDPSKELGDGGFGTVYYGKRTHTF